MLRGFFIPAKIVNNNNLHVDDPDYLRDSMNQLQRIIDDFGIGLQADALRVTELHLARNIGIYHHCADRAEQEQAEKHDVEDMLRMLSYASPPHSKRVQSYKNSKFRQEEVLVEGLTRGNIANPK